MWASMKPADSAGGPSPTLAGDMQVCLVCTRLLNTSYRLHLVMVLATSDRDADLQGLPILLMTIRLVTGPMHEGRACRWRVKTQVRCVLQRAHGVASLGVQ